MVQALPTPLLIRFPILCLRSSKYKSVTWSDGTRMGNIDGVPSSGFSPGACDNLGNKPEDVGSLSLPFKQK